ncbi:M1 family metallopeptidase [Algoriphagus aquimarinus]|uniref:M1 family metallopeptidase n=1 Tax=Algoriphagus aquimarinus TaxID=237018 RepID=A0A5C7AJD0_9BACT|nr:M1 family metallopeptidase [Algoriphagus aquimarinus]TXE06695.1 M1 family metallopeptidase [Algoriphagus aquimarinus]
MRRKIIIKLLFAGAMLAGISNSFAQEVKENNQKEFGEFINRKGTYTRSASGKPNVGYWQNKADYQIAVTLDDQAHTLSGNIKLTYTNNSPETLDFIWMQMEQNRFKEDSRGTLTTPIQGNRYNGDIDGGFDVTNLQAKVGSKGSVSSKNIVSDTRMQVWFNEPIPAKGGTATVSMDFSFKVPVEGMDRMGRLEVEDGWIYAFAQWYPKVAVFDDVEGWNVEPYLGAGEFYLEYGDFDYKVTVPYDHIVVGSGELLNPKEVLSKELQDRYAKAKDSDTTVMLITAEELGNTELTRPKQEGTVTWHFAIQNSRDAAFATSRAFIWDAAKINLPSGKKILAQSAYPKESNGADAWSRSTEYTKASIEHYSSTWFEFPYATATNVAADIGGMEYPGLNFCSYNSKGEDLWGVTDHEFGHNWFPMIVGSNERRYPWMDEGFNTFINHYSTLSFNDGEYPSNLNETRRYTNFFTSETREGIDTYPDVVNVGNLGMLAYNKPAFGLLMLREYILGHERFDNAFKSYIKTWSYKHPQPTDFFNHMENVAGENLSWFWQGWFYGTGNIDLGVNAVIPYAGNYVVVLANKGDMPMPVLMEITFEDGSTERKMLPVEIWQRGDTWNYLLKTDKKVTAVVIDPDKLLPDVNLGNDSWPQNVYEK